MTALAWLLIVAAIGIIYIELHGGNLGKSFSQLFAPFAQTFNITTKK